MFNKTVFYNTYFISRKYVYFTNFYIIITDKKHIVCIFITIKMNTIQFYFHPPMPPT